MSDSLPASAKRAVFLSYASQDAEAARRICEALRSGGVEVWFDVEGGLEHGDEWDAKIRHQIRDCVLFIPVISANTQARQEGYFRIEWDLAAERARGIASGVPFILPVAIDDTQEADALVPDRFRAVQWTRLRNGEVPPEVQQRFLKLWSHRTGVLKHETQGVAQVPSLPSAPDAGWKPALPRTVGRRVWTTAGIAGIVFALVAGGWWWLRRPAPASVPPALAKAPEPKPAQSEAGQLAARAYALTGKVGFTRDDLSVATDWSRQATELESGSARAWAVRAWVQGCYLMRNWDLSEPKLQEVQTLANRALTLDPRDADAMNALYQVFEKQRASVEAEKIARRAVEAAPDNYRSHLCLGRALYQQSRTDEARDVLRHAVELFPTNVLCRYELAAEYAAIGTLQRSVTPAEFAASLEQLDAASAIQPFASATILKAVSIAAWTGDLARMRTEVDRLATMPLADRTEDRAVYVAMWAGLLERRPDRVFAAARLTARSYFEDSVVAGPKAWGTALAYRLDHKDALAQQEWLAAEATLRQGLKDPAHDAAEPVRLAATLAWLGRLDEAAQIAAPVEAAWREEMNNRRARVLALYYGARGEAAKAVPYLRQAINKNTYLTDHVLPLDPWWDKLRGQPEFEALLAEAKARIATAKKVSAAETSTAAPAPKLNDKSVAVLAFANLSDDKDNEYFSDGISEELLNVLAKVPGLRVVARTSAFYFKDKSVPIPEIAQQLNVAYVVEGSVRKSGNAVRIMA